MVNPSITLTPLVIFSGCPFSFGLASPSGVDYRLMCNRPSWSPWISLRHFSEGWMS
jgi:hypothetical protein